VQVNEMHSKQKSCALNISCNMASGHLNSLLVLECSKTEMLVNS